MTEVRYSKLLKDGVPQFYLCCEGHATGSQDVCAAVSAVVTSLAGYLANADIWFTSCLDEGYAEIVFDSDDEKLAGAWELSVFGLKQLENTFGDYIRVVRIQ